MWIFGFSPGVCPTESSNLVFSLMCLVSNGRRALLGGIRLGGSVTAGRSPGVVLALRAHRRRVLDLESCRLPPGMFFFVSFLSCC